jgi:RimJ/RimL family protein N-acetyltransferase
MADPFRSERLIYRLVEPEDEELFMTIQADPIAIRNSNPGLAKPTTKANALSLMKAVEEALLGVVICLPGPEASSEPIPIGDIRLSPLRPNLAHHRFTEIGINIIKTYQGKGYGTEAINWALDWAFGTAGIHRVGIRVFEYNEGARRLYEKIGFKEEGVSRQMFWHAGRWWDDIQFGMLDWEWRELRKNTDKP